MALCGPLLLLKGQTMPISTFDIYSLQSLEFDSFIRRVLGPELDGHRDNHEEVLLECQGDQKFEWCGFIGDESAFEPTDVPGERKCPVCKSTNCFEINEEYIDSHYPWRLCEACHYAFMWDDAEGGEEPGGYICPKCGRDDSH